MPTIARNLPTREWFYERYYVEDGFVYWKARNLSRGRPSIRAGVRVATFISECGYYRVVLGRTKYMLSRVIYNYCIDELLPTDEVDHIDQNRLNNNLDNLRKVSQNINKRNKGLQQNNKSGVTGVHLCKKKHPSPNQHKISTYYSARWCDLDGKVRGKSFNVDKLGVEEAFKRASEYRDKMFKELNEQGAGYSDTHGK